MQFIRQGIAPRHCSIIAPHQFAGFFLSKSLFRTFQEKSYVTYLTLYRTNGTTLSTQRTKWRETMAKRLKSSGLWTGEEEFQNFRIVEMPTSGFVEAKITRLPHGKTLLIQIGENEFCLARQIVDAGWAFPLSFSSWPWQRTLVDSLLKLGVISKDTHQDVLTREKAIAEKSQRKAYVRDVKNGAKKLGIELTDEQLAQLAA